MTRGLHPIRFYGKPAQFAPWEGGEFHKHEYEERRIVVPGMHTIVVDRCTVKNCKHERARDLIS